MILNIYFIGVILNILFITLFNKQYKEAAEQMYNEESRINSSMTIEQHINLSYFIFSMSSWIFTMSLVYVILKKINKPNGNK